MTVRKKEKETRRKENLKTEKRKESERRVMGREKETE